METSTQNFLERRKNFMETFAGNLVLTDMIPGIASKLFEDEFNITLMDPTHVPIVFTTGWTEVLKFVGSQEVDEFAIDVCGVSLEYVTEYSETDKSTNIVPQLIHKRTPIFTKQTHESVPGASFNAELNAKYNAWRTENLTEILDKIERDTAAYVLNEYGIDLMVSASVFPIMSATYAAGVQIARETKQTINMYNIFEIDVVEGDRILLTPLATVKQYLKNDSKK
jgi:hypothetical protein